MTSIAIEVPKTDGEEIRSLFNERKIDSNAFESSGFDGAAILTFVVEITPYAAGVIGTLVAARENAKKHVSIKYKGVEIKGVSEEKIMEILESQTKPKE